MVIRVHFTNKNGRNTSEKYDISYPPLIIFLRFGSTNTGSDKIILETGSNLLNETTGSDTDDGVDEFLLENNVDGTTLRISDFTGTTTNPNHKTNLAFPSEVTKSA